MATKQSYHQYDATDMPEIRQLRSRILQALKLREKYDSMRSVDIARAMIADVDFRKLGIDATKVTSETKEVMELFELTIADYRAGLRCYINDIFVIEHKSMIEQARTDSSTPAIFDAAYTMAKKYHAKPKRRHRQHKAKSTNCTPPLPSTPTSSPTPTSPMDPSTSTSPAKPHTRSTPRMNPKPATKAQATSPTQSAVNKTKVTTRPRTTTHNSNDPSRTTVKALHKTSQNSIQPIIRPTLKAFYRTTKAKKTTYLHSSTASTSRNITKPLFKF